MGHEGEPASDKAHARPRGRKLTRWQQHGCRTRAAAGRCATRCAPVRMTMPRPSPFIARLDMNTRLPASARVESERASQPQHLQRPFRQNGRGPRALPAGRPAPRTRRGVVALLDSGRHEIALAGEGGALHLEVKGLNDADVGRYTAWTGAPGDVRVCSWPGQHNSPRLRGP